MAINACIPWLLVAILCWFIVEISCPQPKVGQEGTDFAATSVFRDDSLQNLSDWHKLAFPSLESNLYRDSSLKIYSYHEIHHHMYQIPFEGWQTSISAARAVMCKILQLSCSCQGRYAVERQVIRCQAVTIRDYQWCISRHHTQSTMGCFLGMNSGK